MTCALIQKIGSVALHILTTAPILNLFMARLVYPARSRHTQPGHAIPKPGHAIPKPGHAIPKPGQAIPKPGHAKPKVGSLGVVLWTFFGAILGWFGAGKGACHAFQD